MAADGNDRNDSHGNDAHSGRAADSAADTTSAYTGNADDSSVRSGAADGASGSADGGSADGNGPGDSSGNGSDRGTEPVEYVTYTTRSGEVRQRRKRRDSRDYSSAGGSNRNADNGSAADTSETTRQTDENTARVNPPRRTRSASSTSAPMAQNTRELVRDAFEFVFWGIGAATKVPGWELEPDESKELAQRAQNFWTSLDKKKAQRWEAIANKWLPGITFVGAIVAVGAPRVKRTQQIVNERKRGPIRKEQQPVTTTTGQPVTETRYPIAPDVAPVASAGDSESADKLRASPVTSFADIEISE